MACAIRHQAITWANVDPDLCHHMASSSHNELIAKMCLKITHFNENYRQISNISRILAGNKFVDHSDVVGASPVGAAPTTSSFST